MKDPQVSCLTYDRDTGVLSLSLTDGSQYKITNPGYAKSLRERISPGGVITPIQYAWLEQFRDLPPLQKASRERLLEGLRTVRAELTGGW